MQCNATQDSGDGGSGCRWSSHLDDFNNVNSHIAFLSSRKTRLPGSLADLCSSLISTWISSRSACLRDEPNQRRPLMAAAAAIPTSPQTASRLQKAVLVFSPPDPPAPLQLHRCADSDGPWGLSTVPELLRCCCPHRRRRERREAPALASYQSTSSHLANCTYTCMAVIDVDSHSPSPSSTIRASCLFSPSRCRKW